MNFFFLNFFIIKHQICCSFSIIQIIFENISYLKNVVFFYFSLLENNILNLWSHSEQYIDKNMEALPSRCRIECNANIFKAFQIWDWP